MHHLELYIRGMPQVTALGLELVTADSSGRCSMRLPFREELMGDYERGLLHSGVIVTLLDTLGATCVVARGVRPRATLDLHIDYLGSASPLRGLVAEGECYRLTEHVGFVRATCHHGDPAHPVASMAAAFILHPPSAQLLERGK